MTRQPIKKGLPKCRHCLTRFYPSSGSSTQPYCLQDKECIEAAIAAKLPKAKKEVEGKEKKDWQDYKKQRSPIVYEKKNTAYLQDGINMLARMIDLKFYNKCVCCRRDFKPEKQQHGAHFIDVGGNNSIRYNLHNIHASTSDCNLYSSKHKVGYAKGLKQRYGNDYLEMVEGLPLKYPKIKLSAVEIAEKLKLVRKLIRDFETFVFEDAIQAREQLNKLINIYQ